MLDTEVAYLAGFFDGEGYIIICRDKSRLGNLSYRLRIGANQVERTPIDMLQNAFGGLIQINEKNKVNSKHRNIFTWQQHSQKAATALTLMIPYLTVKKGQALFAIEWAGKNKKFQGFKKTEADILWNEEQKQILSAMKGYL